MQGGKFKHLPNLKKKIIVKARWEFSAPIIDSLLGDTTAFKLYVFTIEKKDIWWAVTSKSTSLCQL